MSAQTNASLFCAKTLPFCAQITPVHGLGSKKLLNYLLKTRHKPLTRTKKPGFPHQSGVFDIDLIV
jgi:hypothetical protein